MNFIDSLKEYLNDVITESQNNANEEPELEVRFGTYINSRFHPEFKKAILSNLITFYKNNGYRDVQILSKKVDFKSDGNQRKSCR